jgi:nucleolar protein 15
VLSSKPTKKTRSQTATAKVEEEQTSVAKSTSKAANGKKSTTAKTQDQIPLDVASDADDKLDAEISDDAESDVDDQTEALLKGFESEGDDEDNGEGLEEGRPVPKVPKLSKAEQKLLKAKSDGDDEKPGVVYVGRIPHGFYENEMKEYFKQFGTILKLRLSRNRKTGASRHYAFIQFESATVADIVARTMDNYLLFGHILKVKTVADEQLSPDLWKGANKRFKKVPWNKLEGRRLKQGVSEEQWEKRIVKETQRRESKQKKLNDIGYEFEQPKLKSAKGIAARPSITNGDEGVKAIENGDEVESESAAQQIEAPPAKNSASKRSKRQKAEEAVADVNAPEDLTKTAAETDAVAESIVPKPKKGKKGKKEKSA